VWENKVFKIPIITKTTHSFNTILFKNPSRSFPLRNLQHNSKIYMERQRKKNGQNYFEKE
jgi:hypothetical protein